MVSHPLARANKATRFECLESSNFILLLAKGFAKYGMAKDAMSKGSAMTRIESSNHYFELMLIRLSIQSVFKLKH